MNMFHKRIGTAILCLCISIAAKAQVIIINDNMTRERMSEIKATVVDSLTNEPVPFASVYVTGAKDTVITNFTLTDEKGESVLGEVPFGRYVLHVEMMGFKPYLKDRFFKTGKIDLGTIRLHPDERFLKAAVVNDVGNPIVVKQDTIEFNASSYMVGANSMLKDLLLRMPGMEITGEGKVKFNGQKIDKITVGGKTFFFGDQSVALNNLPAAIVDKIRVIDRDSEAARATGVNDGEREKVLDVALKKEFEHGLFGNVELKAGTTLNPEDEPLRDNRGFLYQGSALLSAFGKEDQLTAILNAQNAPSSNNVNIISVDPFSDGRVQAALSTANQIGANVNTSRIKDVETTVSANYKYSDSDFGSRTARTTYQDDGDLFSIKDNNGKQIVNSFTANMEMKKEKGNIWFHVNPEIHFDRKEAFISNSSETLQDGTFINSTVSDTRSLNNTKNARIFSDITFRNIGAKKGRSVRIDLSGGYYGFDGESMESSVTNIKGAADTRNLRFLGDGHSYSARATLEYTEPISPKISIIANSGFSVDNQEQIRDAFDESGKNEMYSSESRIKNLEPSFRLRAQFKFTKRKTLTLGARLDGKSQESYSKNQGFAQTTGHNEWSWFLSPAVRYRYSNGTDRVDLNVSGYNRRPMSNEMVPALNIQNPSRLYLGNIYLKPESEQDLFAEWNRSDKKRFSNLMARLGLYLYLNNIRLARWYDTGGILYEIPVNVHKPGIELHSRVNYTTPLDKEKLWSLSLNFTANYSGNTSYLATGSIAGLDKDSFDYGSFMAGFWGEKAGSRFYGGESGFKEARTVSLSPSANFSVKYNQVNWSFSTGARVAGTMAKYSLSQNTDMNVLRTSFNGRGSYTTKHGFEINSELFYVFYNGYSDGFGKPEWRWNASITKDIGAFTLSLRAHDILNQTRGLDYEVTANYEEESYRLISGRHILFGVKWNFGKMNKVHSRRAQDAYWNMIW